MKKIKHLGNYIFLIVRFFPLMWRMTYVGKGKLTISIKRTYDKTHRE